MPDYERINVDSFGTVTRIEAYHSFKVYKELYDYLFEKIESINGKEIIYVLGIVTKFELNRNNLNSILGTPEKKMNLVFKLIQGTNIEYSENYVKCGDLVYFNFHNFDENKFSEIRV